jgi:MFS transporter, DHA1 family, tetracycline resistance protein
MPDAPSKGSLFIVFFTVFIDLLGFGMVLPLLPLYARQFSVDESGWTIGLLMSSFSAMTFLFAPLWGRLSDRIGRRPTLMFGLAGSVAFYSLFAVAANQQSLALLFAARIGAGIMGATIPVAQAYIADTTTRENRAKGMALIGAAFGMGFTFGPLLGFFAAPSGTGDPGPGPGYAAAGLSLAALVLAWFKLPESLRPDSRAAAHQLFDTNAWRNALAARSIGPLLLALFVCIFGFANFETTLSPLVFGGGRLESHFDFDYQQVMLMYAYIGLTLTIAQGVLVRRLAGKLGEGTLAAAGAIIEAIGFAIVIVAIEMTSTATLFVALTAVVIGFAFMQPSLNALISRRSDPARQGSILGVAQSVSSLARIAGPLLAFPLLYRAVALPYASAIALMAVGFVLILFAAGRGADYGEAPREEARISTE